MKITLIIVALLSLTGCTFWNQPAAYLPSKNGIEMGEKITVKPNQNVYSIAHENNVSMRDLIVLNDLKPPFNVKPGQSLYLPATGDTFAGDVKAPESAPLDSVEKNPLAPITTQKLAPVLTTQNATTKQGEALPAPVASEPATQPVASSQAIPSAPTSKSIAAMSAPEAASSAATADSIEMVWPVQGPILSAFGSKGPGLNNDGINIGAPKGAPVVAAADGTVVYAGDEMKGFGNLVLIRHEGNWVTAYSHLDRVLVKKNATVSQGDMIGTVGKTGNISSPQLHFETRQAGKPVDPSTVIKDSL
jgi:murein DD-endopeptidase MepM/ murein hydrolase activator NlpD